MPLPMDADTRVVAARDQVSVEVEGEAVILSLADGVYYGLDPVGARVWTLLEQPRTVAELRDAVVAEWEVDAPTAERDLLALLDALAGRGLVEVQPAA
ncbi:PqqD family protein [Longimicrobium sp.]|uniref:PqqD family protein n=1 Tax=Longimicrobium sp. TaxID=2029185 RepID=UPI002E365D76|nr:PqqD family protein [Longimicrobium sp.]HEX6039031.1 PqqD family protein [Longimicrobium sp.]